MKSEDKELLVRDLSARLPYGVIINSNSVSGELLSIDKRINGDIVVTNKILSNSVSANLIENIKPYLRPMSSMTEEERIESLEFAWIDDYGRLASYNENIPKYIDWLNKKMFDYRGLIPMGLAIAVTRENNPYEN